MGGLHSAEPLAVPGSEGRGVWVLVQLGESAAHQSATLRYPAHRSGQNVAPAPGDCVATEGVSGQRLGWTSALGGAQGFPSACLHCDLSSSPSARGWGCHSVSSLSQCRTPGACTERGPWVQGSLLKEPAAWALVTGRVRPVSLQRAPTSLSDPQWLPPASARQRPALHSWSLSFQRGASSELSLLLHK